MDLSIQINSTGMYLDLLPGSYLAIDLQIFDLYKLETRTGVVTNDFKIPNSLHNVNALGVNFSNDNITSQSNMIAARCYRGGLLASSGFLHITGVSSIGGTNGIDNIDVTFYGDNIEIFEALRGKTFQDLDLSYLNHRLTAANVTGSFNNTEGYIYLPIDYGAFADRTTNVIAAGEIFPAYFFSDILKAMFRDIGYKVEGSLLNRSLFKKSVVPFINDLFESDDKSFYVGNSIDGIRYPIAIPPLTMVSQGFITKVDSSAGVRFSNALFDLTTLRYTADDAYSIKVNYAYNTRQYYADNNINNFRDADYPQMFIYKNGVEILTGGVSPGYPQIHTTVTMAEGDYLEFKVYNTTTDVMYFTGSAKGAINQGLIENSFVYANKVLPDIPQVDFLKFLFFRFLAVMAVDSFSKTVYLNQFNDIYNNEIDDWSDKVDASRIIETSYIGTSKNFAKRNLGKYTQDTNDTYQESYFRDNKVPFGSGQFNLDLPFLEDEKTVFETKFSGTFLKNTFSTNKLLIPYIPRILDTSSTNIDPYYGYRDLNLPEPRVLTVYGNMNIIQLSNFTEMVIMGTTVTEIPFSYFYKPVLNSDADILPESLAFGVQNIFAPNDIGAFETDYVGFITLISNPVIKRAYLKLTS